MDLEPQVVELYENIQVIEQTSTYQQFFRKLVELVLPDENPDIIQYLSDGVLSKFQRSKKLRPHKKYMAELEKKARIHKNEGNKFNLYAHIGNFSLFTSGIFPKALNQKGQLDKEYYSFYGRRGYRHASRCGIARDVKLDRILHELSFNFEHYVAAFNELSENYLPMSEELMTEMMFTEFEKYKDTKDIKYLESARRRAVILGIKKEKFPSLFR